MLLPALTGDFGVMPGHVPTIAQLRPGVVTVHRTMDKEIERYFVSSGFAFVHADSSADVCAIEAVKLEDLDPEAVRSGLQVIIPLHFTTTRPHEVYRAAGDRIVPSSLHHHATRPQESCGHYSGRLSTGKYRRQLFLRAARATEHAALAWQNGVTGIDRNLSAWLR